MNVRDINFMSYINTTLMNGCTRPTGIQEVVDSILDLATYLLHRFGHEMISMAILSLLLIQEGQLSVTGKSMCTWYWLTS